jgi:DNA replication protein DnaC
MSIEKKKQYVKRKIIEEHGNNPHEPKCARALRLIDLMFESNIPAGYWFVKMKGFAGSKKLEEIVNDYIDNIKDKYTQGTSICLAGNQGTGKTMSSICILKAALKRDFSVHYTTASDIMADMTNYDSSSGVRKTLRETDFLVIDELDSRFFPSDAQKELFSSIYESIFRFRAHNNLPTIICTNETDDILSVFCGQAKQAIDSLNKQYITIYPVVGTDYRKRVNNEDISG